MLTDSAFMLHNYSHKKNKMKKIVLLSATFLSGLIVYAQKVKEAQVPAAVKSAFQKQYPNTKATWEKEKSNYEVTFKRSGADMSVVINNTGTIVETETD